MRNVIILRTIKTEINSKTQKELLTVYFSYHEYTDK